MSGREPGRVPGAGRWILLAAEGFGSGRLRWAPGTWGTLPGCLWFFLLILSGNPWVYVGGTLAGIAVAVWVCGRAEHLLGRTDPPSVVLDEIVAMPVVMAGYVGRWWWQAGELPPWGAIGQWWPVLLGGFIAFRVFDIWKPWPIRRLQHLPGGWGVVVDDVLAGVVAAVVLSLGVELWFWFRLAAG